MLLTNYSTDKLTPKPKTILSRGLNASPGAACGTIVFTAEDAENKAKDGPVILLREETSPDDINGMHVAKGVITSRGGMTSHAAVVARGMGAPVSLDVVKWSSTSKKKLFLSEKKI